MRKLVLLFLLALASALGLVLLLQRNVGAPQVILNIFADAALGVVMGLGSRMVFRRRHWLPRAILSLAFSVLGLVILGQLTAGASGIGPVHLQRVPLDSVGRPGGALPLPSPLGTGQRLLVDLAHIVLAVCISWITLRAWNGGHRVSVAPTAPRDHPEPRFTLPAKPLPAVVPAPKMTQLPRIQRRPGLHLRAKKAAATPLRVRTPQARIARPARPARRWRSLLQRKPGVRLATFEEHRCPYCLETVRRNDPRGSVECPVCHTLHHKDCWDITGTCQVPHLTV